MALVVLMRQSGVRSVGLYVIVGAGGWYAVHESGVHPTIAGVALGLLTPARPWISDNLLVRAVDEVSDFLKGDEGHNEAHLDHPGALFETLGFRYSGPMDGHDLPALQRTRLQQGVRNDRQRVELVARELWPALVALEAGIDAAP